MTRDPLHARREFRPKVYFRTFPSLAKRVKKKQTPLGRRRVPFLDHLFFFPRIQAKLPVNGTFRVFL